MGLIFTLLMTYGGAVVGLFRPFYGFLIYVSFSIIRPEALWHWSVPQGNYSRIIAVSFLLGWVFQGFGTARFAIGRGPAWCLAGFWLWALVSTVFCEHPEAGFAFLESMGKIVLPAIAGLTLISSWRQVYYLAWTIVLSFGYVAFDLNVSYFEGFNRLQDVGFAGMDNNSLTIGLVTCAGYAFFLGLAEKITWRRYLAFACAALMTHAVFFSFSRGGMLGLCVLGAATVALIPKKPGNVALLGLGFAVALAMAGPQVLERFSTVTNNSITSSSGETELDWSSESRLHLWKICLEMTKESPLLGKGPDHFPLLVHRYRIDSTVKNHFGQGKEAHTLWLQIAAELGVVGVLLLFAFYGLTVRSLWKYRRDDPDNDTEPINQGSTTRMVCASLTGFLVSAQFVSLEGLEVPYYIAVSGIAALNLQPVPTAKVNVRPGVMSTRPPFAASPFAQ